MHFSINVTYNYDEALKEIQQANKRNLHLYQIHLKRRFMSAKYFPKSKWSEGKYQAECPTDTKEPIRRHSMIYH